MEKVRISCPHCGFSKEVPAGSVPSGPFKVTCPQCRQAFVQRGAESAPAPAPKAAPAPPPPSPAGEMARVECPHCGFAKEVPRATLPKGQFKITCPKCKQASVQQNLPAEAQPAPGPAAAPAPPAPPSGAAPAPAMPAAGGKARIQCPHCGFAKEVPRDAVPRGKFKITCPKCKQASVQGEEEAEEAPRAPAPPAPPTSAPEPYRAPEPEPVPAPPGEYAQAGGREEEWPSLPEAPEPPGGEFAEDALPAEEEFVEDAIPADEFVEDTSAEAPPERFAAPAPPAQPAAARPERGTAAISCAKCGYSKEMPRGMVPEGAQITCPKCGAKSRFPEGAPAPAAPSAPSYKAPAAPSGAAVSERGAALISCAECGYSKEVPVGLVPEGATVTCPKCGAKFTFSETGAAAVSASRAAAAGGASLAPAGGPSSQAEPFGPPEEGDDEFSAGQAEERPSGPAGPRAAFEEWTPRKTGLSDLGELLGDAWNMYIGRFFTFFGYYFLGSVLVLLAAAVVGAAFAAAGDHPIVLVSVGTVALIAGVSAFTWCYNGLIISVTDDGVGFGKGLREGWFNLPSFMWLVILLAVVIGGGYILLIIPGIFVYVALLPAVYIIVEEKVKGLDALAKSMEYVKGYWWGVFWRVLVVGIFSAIIGAIPFIGPLLSLAFAPFPVIFTYLIYRDLRDIKGAGIAIPSGTRKALIALGVIGALALVAAYVLVSVQVMNNLDMFLDGLTRV